MPFIVFFLYFNKMFPNKPNSITLIKFISLLTPLIYLAIEEKFQKRSIDNKHFQSKTNSSINTSFFFRKIFFLLKKRIITISSHTRWKVSNINKVTFLGLRHTIFVYIIKLYKTNLSTFQIQQTLHNTLLFDVILF